MGQMMTTAPAGLDTSMLPDRWEPYRCESGRRMVDINQKRREVRYRCDRCRKDHVVPIGVPKLV